MNNYRLQQSAMLPLLLACFFFATSEPHVALAGPAPLGPESRAGNVEPATDYEATLTTN